MKTTPTAIPSNGQPKRRKNTTSTTSISTESISPALPNSKRNESKKTDKRGDVFSSRLLRLLQL